VRGSESDKSFKLSENSIYDDTSYLANNPDWHVAESPWKAQEIHEMLAKNNLAPKTIAEVGCGAGEILIQLEKRLPNCSFVGYEPSPQAFELARRRERENVHFIHGGLFDEQVRFDVLLCIDVFEHVDDYIGFVRSLKKYSDFKIFHIPLDLSVQSVLREGALLKARDTVGHLHYFSKATALATLKYCGYDVIDYRFTGLALEPPNRGLRANLMKFPRKAFSAISVDFAARVLGGWSLLVLAK
jgi:SAM-dependent methyltransferase